MSTSEPPTHEPSAEVPAPGRGRWRRRLALLAAGLVLAAVLLVALAPALASSFARGPVERAFAERFQGRLEVEALHLAWTGRQRIEGARLFDPDGARVAGAEVELPGLWSLLAGRGKHLGSVRVVLDADLVRDDAGLSNLDRALAPRVRAHGPGAGPAAGERGDQPSAPPPGDGPGGEGPGRLRDLSIDLELLLEHLSYEDALTRGTGAPFVLDDFTARLDLRPGGFLEARAAGLLATGSAGALRLEASAQNLFEAASSAEPPRLDLDLELSDMPVALIDQLAGQGGRLSDLLGERVTLVVRGQGTPLAGDASVRLDSERVHVSARGEIEGGVLRSSDGFALEADVSLSRATFLESTAELVPVEYVLRPDSDEVRLRARVSRLALPIAAVIDARAAGADVLAALAAAGELALDLELGDWTVGAVGVGEPLQVTGLGGGARVVALGGKARADLELRAGLGGSQGGGLSARLSAPDLVQLLACARGEGSTLAEASLELARLPSELLAAWTVESGLAELLGPTLDVSAGFDGELALAGPSSGRLRLDLQTRERRLTARLDALLPGSPLAGGLPELELRGELGGLVLVRPLVPEVAHALFDELLGESLVLDLHSRAGEAGATRIDLQATTARTRLEFAGSLGPDGVATRGEQGLRLTARPSQELLERYLAPSLPAGASLRLSAAQEAFELRVTGLDWPASATEAGAEPESLGARLERARAELELLLPAFVWRQPPPTESGAAVDVGFERLRTLASLAPASGLALDVAGQLSGSEAARLELRLALPRPAQLLAETKAPRELTLSAHGQALPTALVDALAVQDGLLVDVFGDALDLELEARLPAAAEGLRLVLRSPSASLELVGALERGTLVAREAQGLRATLPLSPLFTERIVGSLLPMAVSISKPADAPPARLLLSDFTLPLDGDLRKLSANLRLNLNQVSYRVLPGFEDLIARASDGQASSGRTLNLPPLNLVIREGLLTYERLPLEIGGKAVELAGTFDLVTREMDLATELPLDLLGEKVGRELARAREHLDPNTGVPLRISGQPSRPRVSIGREFVDQVLEKAAKDALEKGLGDLLKKAGKKDG